MLVPAILVVVGDLDPAGFFGVGTERFESGLQRLLKIAANPTGPADFQHASTTIEHNAGLILLRTLGVGQAVDIDITQPWRERLLQFLL